MVFLCDSDGENLIVLKCILRLFKLMSGLKVNFSKNKLLGINVGVKQVKENAKVLGCEVETGQFTYLGMKIEINPNRRNSWSELILKVRNRIASWGSRSIAMGGRVTLNQSVIFSIPIYFLSFYLLPKKHPS